MKIVLDTNVLVSAVLSPHGPPAAVLRALLTERVTACFDERIIAEYREVLTRRAFGFDHELVAELLNFLEAAGTPTLAEPISLNLPDADDQMFVEVAVSSGADYFVTGNLKHFPEDAPGGVRVISPREFLDALLA